MTRHSALFCSHVHSNLPQPTHRPGHQRSGCRRQAFQVAEVGAQLRQAPAEVGPLPFVGKAVEVGHQVQSGLLGTLQRGLIVRTQQRLALLQQLRDAVIEIVAVALLDRGQ